MNHSSGIVMELCWIKLAGNQPKLDLKQTKAQQFKCRWRRKFAAHDFADEIQAAQRAHCFYGNCRILPRNEPRSRLIDWRATFPSLMHEPAVHLSFMVTSDWPPKTIVGR